MKEFVWSYDNLRTKSSKPEDEGYLKLAEEILNGIHENIEQILRKPTDSSVESMLRLLQSDYVDILSMGHGKEVLADFKKRLVTSGYWPASAI